MHKMEEDLMRWVDRKPEGSYTMNLLIFTAALLIGGALALLLR